MSDEQSLWIVQLRARKNTINRCKQEIKDLKKLLKESKK